VNRVFLSLGSNINKEHNLPAAVQLLRDRVLVRAVSSVYETEPRGTLDQPTFFNAAVLIETDLGLVAIKERLIDEVEGELSRQRQADKNAPRTIDIDIALFNDEIMAYVPADGRSRRVPDPDILTFIHVAAPLAELAPDQIHPQTGERLDTIAARLEAAAEGQQIRVREDISLL
jgi:2-amino-4-hydroxy-6-hydroxymethyldihydropteridine diphosphokinase